MLLILPAAFEQSQVKYGAGRDGRDASGGVNCAETLDGNVVLETLSLSLTVLLSLALGNAVTANLFFSSRWRLELKGHPSGPRTNQLLNDCK